MYYSILVGVLGTAAVLAVLAIQSGRRSAAGTRYEIWRPLPVEQAGPAAAVSGFEVQGDGVQVRFVTIDGAPPVYLQNDGQTCLVQLPLGHHSCVVEVSAAAGKTENHAQSLPTQIGFDFDLAEPIVYKLVYFAGQNWLALYRADEQAFA